MKQHEKIMKTALEEIATTGTLAGHSDIALNALASIYPKGAREKLAIEEVRRKQSECWPG